MIDSDKVDTLIDKSLEKGGKRAKRNSEWWLAYYTMGHRKLEDDTQVVCIYIPIIKAQVEIPEEELEGNGPNAWHSKVLLTCLLREGKYVDGLDDNGIFIHTPEPQLTFSDYVKEVEQLDEGRDSNCTEAFKASPNRKPSLTQVYGESCDAWSQNRNVVTNIEDSQGSPVGKSTQDA